MGTFSTNRKVYKRLSIGLKEIIYGAWKTVCTQYFKFTSKVKREQEISLPGEECIFLMNAEEKTKLPTLL